MQPVEIVTQLRAAHAKGEKSAGINVKTLAGTEPPGSPRGTLNGMGWCRLLTCCNILRMEEILRKLIDGFSLCGVSTIQGGAGFLASTVFIDGIILLDDFLTKFRSMYQPIAR